LQDINKIYLLVATALGLSIACGGLIRLDPKDHEPVIRFIDLLDYRGGFIQ